MFRSELNLKLVYQGDHLSRNPGNVSNLTVARECQEIDQKGWEMSGKILLGKTLLLTSLFGQHQCLIV